MGWMLFVLNFIIVNNIFLYVYLQCNCTCHYNKYVHNIRILPPPPLSSANYATFIVHGIHLVVYVKKNPEKPYC